MGTAATESDAYDARYAHCVAAVGGSINAGAHRIAVRGGSTGREIKNCRAASVDRLDLESISSGGIARCCHGSWTKIRSRCR